MMAARNLLPPASLLICLLSTALLFPVFECGRIMFYMPFVSKSMRITYMPVVRELAARGHEVTVVTPYDSKEPDNVHMVIIDSPFEEILDEVQLYNDCNLYLNYVEHA